MNRGIVIIVLGCLAGILPAAGRTWTSASGATVEADFVALQDANVVLQNAAGRRFEIRLDQLSAADQEYVRKQAGAAAPAARQAQPAPGELAARPRKATTAEFPPVDLKSKADAVYFGLQYGGGADEIMLVVFDVPAGALRGDTAYVYAPGLPRYRTPVKVSSSGRTIDGQRAFLFRGIELAGTYGSIRAQFDVEFVFGAVDESLLWFKADARLAGPGGQTTYTIGGDVNSVMTVGEGDITVLPLLSRPSFRFHVRAPPQYVPPTSTIGLRGNPNFLSLIPGRGMDNRARVTVTGEDGRRYESFTASWSADSLLKTHQYRDPNHRFESVRPGQQYTIEAVLNLGPVFGEVAGETTFDFPASR